MAPTESPEIAYWREGLQTALEGAGCFDALTPEQYTAAAPIVAQWADDKGMAFGEHCIPDPVNAEHQRQVHALQARITELEKFSDQMGTNFVAAVARMHRMNPDRFAVTRDGHVEERR